MSKLNDLTAITTPSLSDLIYCVQNSTDYKVTNQQLLDLIKTNTVIPLTQTQYDNLTPAEKNNGSIYIITDASITADDIEYTSGVSVGDKLDSLDNLFLTQTYTATKTVNANGVVALLGSDMGYNSIPTGYTPIVYTFACTNSNDLFCNLNNISAIGAAQFGVIRNVSSSAQNDKVCKVSITFVKSAYL